MSSNYQSRRLIREAVAELEREIPDAYEGFGTTVIVLSEESAKTLLWLAQHTEDRDD